MKSKFSGHESPSLHSRSNVSSCFDQFLRWQIPVHSILRKITGSGIKSVLSALFSCAHDFANDHVYQCQKYRWTQLDLGAVNSTPDCSGLAVLDR